MVTQKDIALVVGIDRSMVAHALRGDSRVSEETRLRVVEVAQEMGYDAFSNGAARSMIARRYGKRAKTGTIAILMGDYFEGQLLEDMSFFRELIEGFRIGAAATDVEMLFCSSSPRPGTLPRVLTKGNVDGALAVHLGEINASLRLHELAIPVLCVGDAAPGEAAILVENQKGIADATRHLIEMGHRKIAYVGDLPLSNNPDQSYRERLAGYESAMKSAGLEIDAKLLVTDIGSPTKNAGAHGFDELQKRGAEFSAVVCFNDQSALGLIERAQERGLRVPDDLSVTGFDGGMETFGDGQTLTSARYDRVLMGKRCIELLCRVIDGAPKPIEVIPVELRAGDSTRERKPSSAR